MQVWQGYSCIQQQKQIKYFLSIIFELMVSVEIVKRTWFSISRKSLEKYKTLPHDDCSCDLTAEFIQ